MKNSIKNNFLMLSLLCLQGASLYAARSESVAAAICQAAISVPANYSQLQLFAKEGNDLHCNCLVRQRTEFLSMNKTIVSFYDPTISEAVLQNNFNTNSFVETIYATPLYIALSREDYGLLRVLMENKIDLNRRFDDGMLPLEYAMHSNRPKMVNFLLQHGAEPTYVTIGCPYNLDITKKLILLGANATTIDVECLANNPTELKKVLDLIPDFSTKKLNQNELHQLFQMPDLLEIMLNRGLDVNQSVEIYDAKGQRFEKSFLVQAIEKRNEQVLDLLLKHGAAVNKHNSKGWTPIFYAIKANSANYLKKLIEKGASVNEISTNKRETPLGLTIDLGFGELLKILLETGAKPYLDALEKADLPLVKALQKKDKTMIEWLLQYTEDTHLAIHNYYENKDLLAAPQLLDFALSVGLKPNNEILKMAILENNSQVVSIILDNNPNWNTDAINVDLPPIYQAFQQENTVIATQLIKSGADVNMQISGENPLIIQAIEQNSLVLVFQLLRNKANPNVVDKSGTTALQIAIKTENIDIVKLLIDANADVTCYDMLLAFEYDNLKIIKLIHQKMGNFDCKIDGKSLRYHTRSMKLSLEVEKLLKRENKNLKKYH